MGIKMYTIYTESHSVLLNDFFIPSISQIPNIELVIDHKPQECSSGEYMSSGWLSTMKHKVSLHIEACKKTEDKVFIYSDCDVLFLNKDSVLHILNHELADHDIVCQNDVILYNNRPTCCAGFFVCKTNNKTVKLWENVLKKMNDLPDNTTEQDQSLLNYYLDKSDINYGILSHKFFTLAQHKTKLWDQTNNPFEFDIPKDIMVYHANWTHGIANKIALLNYVKLKYKTND
jgi:hypothetical protein